MALFKCYKRIHKPATEDFYRFSFICCWMKNGQAILRRCYEDDNVTTVNFSHCIFNFSFGGAVAGLNLHTPMITSFSKF